MKRLFIILAVLAPVAAAAQTVFPAERLEAAVRACRAGDARAVEAVAALRDAAAEYLAMEPVSVVDKEILPPSGDRRDYMTLSPYWWPDPSREDGLPYIRRDGERNPEVYDYPERVNSGRLGDAAQVLSVLYASTGEERYAAKCAELLRVWFLDPERGMNPNMTYAQLIPGRTAVRGTGIIDSRRFCRAFSAAALLRGSE
ncbi:MAG: alginate lyase family protein, partial [Alistipes sp.]|nr:alginate lyase family protein [Alistipes sp.]